MSTIGLHLKKHQRLEHNMSETLTQLAEVSNRTARSTIAVIDAMTQRGAFKGEELSTIGDVLLHDSVDRLSTLRPINT